MEDNSRSLFKIWETIKQNYSDAIIILRNEKTYITFEKDAALLHKLVPATLKSNNKDYLYYTFKFQKPDNILHKLVKCNYKVAVCNQL